MSTLYKLSLQALIGGFKPMGNYAGIDYGLGMANVDKDSGIRYGVISQHSIMLGALDDFESEYGDPHCPECGDVVKPSDEVEPDDDEVDWHDGKDYACENCRKCFWSESCFPDEALGISYEADGYKITDCLDTDLFILESPYFTYAQFCSPCVPGAGNLDTPMDEPETGAKCYCLGHDWFEDGKAPYVVYLVETGEVIAG